MASNILKDYRNSKCEMFKSHGKCKEIHLAVFAEAMCWSSRASKVEI
jgi:hypothetical protein